MKKHDDFFQLKYIGYCYAQMPYFGNVSPDDFANFCKFQLCLAAGKLMKDPIWEEYTREELIAEYFAWQFKPKEGGNPRVDEFEQVLKGQDPEYAEDFLAWADKKIDDNKAELVDKASEMEGFSFKPGDVIGE